MLLKAFSGITLSDKLSSTLDAWYRIVCSNEHVHGPQVPASSKHLTSIYHVTWKSTALGN